MRQRPPGPPLLLLAVVATAAASASLRAQRQFEALQSQGLPFDLDPTLALVHGDVDGDGDEDLVVGNRGQNRLYLNDGFGNFRDVTAAQMPLIEDPTFSLALGDVDGDGDLDLVVGNSTSAGAQNLLLLNDGVGTFSDATSQRIPARANATRSVVLADVDGDGDLDLVAGNYELFAQRNDLYLNDGTGSFTDATATRLPQIIVPTTCIAAADLDRDGDLDLVVGIGRNDRRADNRFYRNDGTGHFTDATNATMPASQDSTTSVAVADVDGDGDLDIVFGNDGSRPLPAVPPQRDLLFLNNGAGGFANATSTNMPPDLEPTAAVRFGDVDGDGDPDLIVGTTRYGSNRRDRLYLNDGTGRFQNATNGGLPAIEQLTYAVAAFDSDADGDIDLAVAVAGRNRTYRNDGTGVFADVTDLTPRLPEVIGPTSAIALGDVDGDGDLDVLRSVNDGAPRVELLLNEGGASFRDATPNVPPITVPVSRFVLFDADLDGDLDMFAATGPQPGSTQDRLFLNNGLGQFVDATTSNLPRDGTPSSSAAGADVDADGDLDLLIAKNGQSRLYKNDGTGRFADVTTSDLPARLEATTSLAFGDLDRDGDLDLVLGNQTYYYNTPPFGATGGEAAVYLNDGSGRFTDATRALLPSGPGIRQIFGTNALALGDVNGDGHLDLVTTHDPVVIFQTYFGGGERLFLNAGNGAFQEAPFTQFATSVGFSESAAMGDLDGDGNLDLVFASTDDKGRDAENRIHINDGRGTFTRVYDRLETIPTLTDDLVLGDLDGDGDLDMFAANRAQDRVYLNLLRQTHAPEPARVGRDYTVEVYARYGAPRLVDTALPYLSTATARIPTIFGVVGIDPSEAFPLPAFVVPQPLGVGTVTFAIPNDPNLIGLSVHAQALLVPLPGTPRVTNVTFDVVH